MKKILSLLFIIIFTLFVTLFNKSKEYFINVNTREADEKVYSDYIDNLEVENLELPVKGASGYASISLNLKENYHNESQTLSLINEGEGFKILKENGSWWNVEYKGLTGWIEHEYCFINLPDVIPSIIYNNTNAYLSKFTSSGKEIPNLTGEILYNSKFYNERLGRDEYIVPVFYSTARKICIAQQNALDEGNSIIIYEAFRPYEVQKKIINELTTLANSDAEVMKGINSYPWTMSWFINTKISNHQKGVAVDVGLAKVNTRKSNTSGKYIYTKVTDYTEYTMPTQIHELSIASATFTEPVSSLSETAWKKSTLSSSMNSESIKLQSYFTNAGFTPLASEWWHFNDLESLNTVHDSSMGNYIITECLSSAPY